MAEKSTIQTSRKIYAMKYGLRFVGGVVAVYVCGKYFVSDLDAMVFTGAITAVGVIIGALNIADGMKRGE